LKSFLLEQLQGQKPPRMKQRAQTISHNDAKPVMLKGDLDVLDKSAYVIVKSNRRSGDLTGQTYVGHEEGK